MQIHESAEDYLEKILMLKERLGQVRSIDIATELGYSKPSISIAMKKLRENGYIEMGPMAGQSGTPVGGAITAGKYKIRASEGEMIVGIRAQKTIQLTPEQQTADEKAHNVTERVEDIIPDKYNNRSELKATITKGKNTVDFAITTDDAGGAAE